MSAHDELRQLALDVSDGAPMPDVAEMAELLVAVLDEYDALRSTPAPVESEGERVSVPLPEWEALVAEAWDMPVDESAVTAAVFALLDAMQEQSR